MNANNGELVPFDVSLTDYQKSLIKRPYQESSIVRGFAYLKEEGVARKVFSPSNALGMNLSTQDTVQMSVATGSAGYAASLVAGAGAFACTGKAATVATGALLTGASLVGCIGALAIFEGVIICINLFKIYNSPEYLAWIARRKEIMTNAAVLDFLKRDTILRHLLCPLTGELPLLPAKTGHGITYDYHAAVEWIEANPDKALPGLNKLVEKEDFFFDYAHINSVIERLYNLRTVLVDEAQALMKRRLQMVNIQNADADIWISVVKILVVRGHINLGQAFFNDESLGFVHKVLYKCGHDLRDGVMNRRERYRSDLMELVKMPATNASEKLVMFRAHMALIHKAGVIKNLYVKTLANQDSAFVRFWRTIFFINPHSYFLVTEYDQKNVHGNEILWAAGINIPTEEVTD